MGSSSTHHRRVAPGLLAAGLLLAPLTGCGNTSDPVDADATPEVTATESAPAGGTDDPAETSAPEDATGTSGTDGGTNADVNCSAGSCSLTLSGDGAQADVLGTPVTLGAVEDGRATVRVGDREVSCSQGESVSAGPLTLECTTVTADTVTMTASLG
jgi:hypothetical protein